MRKFVIIASLILSGLSSTFAADEIQMEKNYPLYAPIVAVVQTNDSLVLFQQDWRFPIGIKAKFPDPSNPGLIHMWAGPGTYTIKATAVRITDWANKKAEPADLSFTFTVGDGPVPPPNPDVDPDPDPVPNPDVDPTPGPKPPPDVTAGFRVIMLEESDARNSLPRAQQVVLTSTTIRAYLNNKTAKFNNVPEWRVWDDDLDDDDLKDVPPMWKSIYTKAKQDSAGKLPWLVITDGKQWISVELPADEAKTLELLKKYGGQ